MTFNYLSWLMVSYCDRWMPVASRASSVVCHASCVVTNCFKGHRLLNRMVSQIYHSELQLNNTNTSDTEAAFLDLHLSIMSNDIVSTKIYDERDEFHFEIVNIPFLDGDVPRSTSYGVSQFIRFASLKEYQNIKSLLLASEIIMCAEKE